MSEEGPESRSDFSHNDLHLIDKLSVLRDEQCRILFRVFRRRNIAAARRSATRFTHLLVHAAPVLIVQCETQSFIPFVQCLFSRDTLEYEQCQICADGIRQRALAVVFGKVRAGRPIGSACCGALVDVTAWPVGQLSVRIPLQRFVTHVAIRKFITIDPRDAVDDRK